MHTRAVLSLAASLALVACSRKAETPPAATGPNEVTVVATDYAFAAPETLPAGLTTLHLVNGGQEAHHMVLTHIADGKTLADFQAAAKDMKIPDWMSFPGSPGATAPGDTTSTTS